MGKMMPGVTDDRRAPSLGSTEKENTVSSPVVSQAAVPKDSTNEGETKPANEPSAAAKLGLVHSDAADDGSAEAVVGWESFTGKEPTIPTEEASFLNTLPQKPPTLPTWGFLVVNTVDFVLGFDQDIHKLFSLLTCSLLEIRDHSSLHTARAMLTKKTLWRMFFDSVVSDF